MKNSKLKFLTFAASAKFQTDLARSPQLKAPEAGPEYICDCHRPPHSTASQRGQKEYAHRVVVNCKAFADEFIRLGYKVVTGGTDNHVFLIDISELPITGAELQERCDENHITLNKNAVPGDKRPPKEKIGRAHV